MYSYCTYDIETGKILTYGVSSAEPTFAEDLGEIRNINTNTIVNSYVDISTDQHFIREKQELDIDFDKTTIIAGSGEVATLSGIPPNTEFTIESETVLVEDGVLELSFDDVGSYKIYMDSIPYINKYWVIEAI